MKTKQRKGLLWMFLIEMKKGRKDYNESLIEIKRRLHKLVNQNFDQKSTRKETFFCKGKLNSGDGYDLSYSYTCL